MKPKIATFIFFLVTLTGCLRYDYFINATLSRASSSKALVVAILSSLTWYYLVRNYLAQKKQ